MKVAYHLLYRLTPPYENLYQDSGPTADSSYTSQAYNPYLCENFSQLCPFMLARVAGKAFIVIKELVLENLYNPCTCLEADIFKL